MASKPSAIRGARIVGERFVRSQQREVEHIDTTLTRAQFGASRARQGRM